MDSLKQESVSVPIRGLFNLTSGRSMKYTISNTLERFRPH